VAVTTRNNPLSPRGFFFSKMCLMPTYEYVCKDNGHVYQETRGMFEEPRRTICVKPDCGSRLVRKFSPPPITFKGGGFHSTKG